MGAFFFCAGRALAFASAACAAAETGFEPFFLAAARAFSKAATSTGPAGGMFSLPVGFLLPRRRRCFLAFSAVVSVGAEACLPAGVPGSSAKTAFAVSGLHGEPSATDGTAEKLKKQRRRRGKKPAPGKENVAPKDVAPAGPVDVAAVLKARAAAKKGGRKQSDAQKAALANAKARPAQKKKAPKGRQVADPGCNGY